jgi:hypothetical protein
LAHSSWDTLYKYFNDRVESFIKIHTLHNDRVETVHRVLVGTLREGDHWGDPDVDGRIILRRIFRKWEGWRGLDGAGSG